MFYEKKINIGYSNIGKDGVLKVVSIMNFLQDTAAEHSARMGLSGFDLAEKNLAWVISRYRIEILNRPAWLDEIAIRTECFSCRNLYEIRQFTITEAEGGEKMENFSALPAGVLDSPADSFPVEAAEVEAAEVKPAEEDGKIIRNSEKLLVTASGCWIMINKNNGRPVRLSRFMERESDRSRGATETGNIWSRDPPDPPGNNNHLKEDNGIESYFQEVIKPENIDYQLTFRVRMHDIDLNGHVNNAVFVEWGVETVPEEILSDFSPSSISVVFNREALYGDFIESYTEIREKSDSLITLHSIIRKSDQTELARLNICWHSVQEN